MSELAQAEIRFKAAQEKLKQFIEEHMIENSNGLEFISQRNQEQLARQLDALRLEHEAAGAEWAAALPVPQAR